MVQIHDSRFGTEYLTVPSRLAARSQLSAVSGNDPVWNIPFRIGGSKSRTLTYRSANKVVHGELNTFPIPSPLTLDQQLALLGMMPTLTSLPCT